MTGKGGRNVSGEKVSGCVREAGLVRGLSCSCSCPVLLNSTPGSCSGCASTGDCTGGGDRKGERAGTGDRAARSAENELERGLPPLSICSIICDENDCDRERERERERERRWGRTRRPPPPPPESLKCARERAREAAFLDGLTVRLSSVPLPPPTSRLKLVPPGVEVDRGRCGGEPVGASSFLCGCGVFELSLFWCAIESNGCVKVAVAAAAVGMAAAGLVVASIGSTANSASCASCARMRRSLVNSRSKMSACVLRKRQLALRATHHTDQRARLPFFREKQISNKFINLFFVFLLFQYCLFIICLSSFLFSRFSLVFVRLDLSLGLAPRQTQAHHCLLQHLHPFILTSTMIKSLRARSQKFTSRQTKA